MNERDDTLEQKVPEYLAYDAAGHCDITLHRPVKLANGTGAEVIRMREPTPSDQLAVESIKQEVKREITLLANLCELSPDDIAGLPMKSYNRLIEGFQGFL